MAITFQTAEFFQAPPDRVFSALTDLEAAGQWMTGLVRIERVDAGEMRAGSGWRKTRKLFGKEATEQFEVTEYERPSRIGLRVDGSKGTTGRGEYLFSYRLEPQNGGTLVHLDGEIRGLSGIWGWMGKLMVGNFKKACVKDLNALNRHLSQ